MKQIKCKKIKKEGRKKKEKIMKNSKKEPKYEKKERINDKI